MEYTWIVYLDLGPMPKISHHVYANTSHSKIFFEIWNTLVPNILGTDYLTCILIDIIIPKSKGQIVSGFLKCAIIQDWKKKMPLHMRGNDYLQVYGKSFTKDLWFEGMNRNRPCGERKPRLTDHYVMCINKEKLIYWVIVKSLLWLPPEFKERMVQGYVRDPDERQV